MFDPTTIVWYAAICGALAALAPSLGTRNRRILVGAVVGIVAASLLPPVHAALGL
ncbi:hypothetical protein [Oceaniradius stylonematis]|uniref:hypothetical protein n=1 Tax=Oceaniradius stylonematis TaxID=2184161 RepID=UPI00273E5220|nr:hypothetical protein [Oceaniradius stylonematis]